MIDYAAPLISCRKALANAEALAALLDFANAIDQIEYAQRDLLSIKASLSQLALRQTQSARTLPPA